MNNRNRIFTSSLATAVAATLLGSVAQAADVYLRAEQFAKSVSGAGTVTMWGYSVCDAGFTACVGPSSPGPDVVVPAGDSSLTIHLQNNLRESTSIMIPGQTKPMSPVRFTDAQGRERISAFDAEVAPGATEMYSWPNLRPGTYLYQSGSHVQLQVQMGLYGALVHDAAANTAYTGVPYAQAKTVVFSEIDPVLHQSFTLPLQADSFETPDAAAGTETASAGGWAVSGGGGVFDPASDAIVVPTDGEQTGWVTSGGALSLAGGTIGPDTSYALSVDVGDRTDTALAGYSIGLYAGGTPLAQDVDQVAPDGAFATRMLSLAGNAPVLAGHYGQPLEIRLASTTVAPVGTPVTVAGGSFEAPAVADGVEGTTATSWTLSGSGAGGVFNPLAAVVPQPTDGAQMGWSSGQRQLAQTLGETLAANTTYSLSVDVGDRTDTPFAGYRVGLYAGGALLAENTDTLTPDGSFQNASVSYTTPASVAAGQALEVRLASTATAPAPAPIAITNFSFETPDVGVVSEATSVGGVQAPNNWTKSNNSNAGVYDPLLGYTGMDGGQVAWSRQSAVLSQTLTGQVLTANSTYNLSVAVGRILLGYSGYSVQLYAGATLIGSATYSGGDPGLGSFKIATGTFVIGASHPALGQTLQVRLASTGGTSLNRTYFDNVVLTRAPADPNRTYFDKVVLTKAPVDARRTLFDKVSLTATGIGKPANALDRSVHPTDGYQPKYFLINGEGNPTNLVTASAGDRILLRLVNAGLQNRAPQLLGGYFEIVGEDGNKAPIARQQYNTLLPAGKSLDVIFVAPTTPGTYTLYDRRLGMSNGSGQIGHIVVGP